ncbi:hypothetical protein, partial [Nocardia tengchongensis]|uniref:hypothetical protein n=1 Tax=Nocardia tengchongensis TaxID=2055889 RepID=UPI0036B07AFF
MAKIKLHQLTQDFYDEHSHLTEIADKNSNGNLEDKGRGYGVLMIEIKGDKFAITLRYKMKQKENFTTKIYKQNTKKYRKGLDYT